MEANQIGEKFAKLALAIDQHRQGYVDSYYGPAEWQLEEEQRGPRPLAQLFKQSKGFLVAIESALDLPDQRRSYLRTEVMAMQTTLRLLQGEPFSLTEEVEGIFDIRPAWVDEQNFESARRQLDELLPPGDSLNERMIMRGRRLTVPIDQLPELCQHILSELRKRARDLFPLPEGENVTLETPKVDEPWGGYHQYLGDYHSQVQINTNYPLQVLELLSMLAHETYPGHHTEAAIKEAQLLRGQGRMEHALIMSSAPSCVIQEGIAMQAIHILLDKEELVSWCQEEIFPRAGLKGIDAAREVQIRQARWNLEEAFGNVAFMLHDRGASREEALAYAERHVPEMPKNLVGMIDFIQDPLLRAYVFSYTHGYWLLERLFDRHERRSSFNRLLSEAVTPSMVETWIV